jgi:hypothetical protein
MKHVATDRYSLKSRPKKKPGIRFDPNLGLLKYNE